MAAAWKTPMYPGEEGMSIARFVVQVRRMATVIGNLVGGLAFTGLTLYSTHIRTAPKRAIQ